LILAENRSKACQEGEGNSARNRATGGRIGPQIGRVVLTKSYDCTAMGCSGTVPVFSMQYRVPKGKNALAIEWRLIKKNSAAPYPKYPPRRL